MWVTPYPGQPAAWASSSPGCGRPWPSPSQRHDIPRVTKICAFPQIDFVCLGGSAHGCQQISVFPHQSVGLNLREKTQFTNVMTCSISRLPCFSLIWRLFSPPENGLVAQKAPFRANSETYFLSPGNRGRTAKPRMRWETPKPIFSAPTGAGQQKQSPGQANPLAGERSPGTHGKFDSPILSRATLRVRLLFGPRALV